MNIREISVHARMFLRKMAAMNPNLTLEEKIEELKADIQRISNKFPAVGEPSTVTVEEIFELCAKQLMLKDLLVIKAKGGTQWYPNDDEVHVK